MTAIESLRESNAFELETLNFAEFEILSICVSISESLRLTFFRQFEFKPTKQK